MVNPGSVAVDVPNAGSRVLDLPAIRDVWLAFCGRCFWLLPAKRGVAKRPHPNHMLLLADTNPLYALTSFSTLPSTIQPEPGLSIIFSPSL